MGILEVKGGDRMGKEPNDETSEGLNQLFEIINAKATRANLEKLSAGAVKRIIIEIMRINRKKKIKNLFMEIMKRLDEIVLQPFHPAEF